MASPLATGTMENPLRERGEILRRYAAYSVAGILVVAMSIHLLVIGTDWSRMGSPGQIAETVISLVPNLIFVPKILGPLFETALMAFWGTLLAVVMSIPVAYLAATTTPPSMILTFPIGRALIVLSRSTHEIIFALIFVSAVGLGPLPGILALGCRSVGFMSKTTAEAIENVNRGPIEAIAATGAGGAARFLFAVVPQVFPVFLGNAIFQFDINIRRASILGMVGAGGIGLHLREQISLLEYHAAMGIIAIIIVLVIISEAISHVFRERLR